MKLESFIAAHLAFIISHSSLLFQSSLQTLYRAPHTLTELFQNLRERMLAAIPSIIIGAIVFLIFIIIAWIGRRLIARIAPTVRADTGAVLLLSRVYYYGVLIIGLIIAVQATGLNVNALVAGLGLTGFAIGFALKDVLSNLLSGIMLLIYRPFHIGDYVKMSEFEGTIEMIRMRDTILRARDGRTIVIPNTKLLTEVVIVNAPANVVAAQETTPKTVPKKTETARAADETEDLMKWNERGGSEQAVKIENV
jgi:small conductance mechanosensitive channel